MKITPIDVVGQNGNNALHYTWTIQGTEYRLGPHAYAMYLKGGEWRESATLTNQELLRIAAEEAQC